MPPSVLLFTPHGPPLPLQAAPHSPLCMNSNSPLMDRSARMSSSSRFAAHISRARERSARTLLCSTSPDTGGTAAPPAADAEPPAPLAAWDEEEGPAVAPPPGAAAASCWRSLGSVIPVESSSRVVLRGKCASRSRLPSACHSSCTYYDRRMCGCSGSRQMGRDLDVHCLNECLLFKHCFKRTESGSKELQRTMARIICKTQYKMWVKTGDYTLRRCAHPSLEQDSLARSRECPNVQLRNGVLESVKGAGVTRKRKTCAVQGTFISMGQTGRQEGETSQRQEAVYVSGAMLYLHGVQDLAMSPSVARLGIHLLQGDCRQAATAIAPRHCSRKP